VTSDRVIFLSHAHVDRALADLVRNTLVLGGVNERRIFYSSSRATGIPSGQDVRTYLQQALREAGLVIELVSETFLRRPICLMELGGAWALGTATYPIVVPPLTRAAAVSNIGDVQMGILGTDSDLNDLFDELHDRIADDVNVRVETTPWNRAIRDFKQQLPAKLAETARAVAEIPTQQASTATEELAGSAMPKPRQSSRGVRLQPLARDPSLEERLKQLSSRRSSSGGEPSSLYSDRLERLEDLRRALAEFRSAIRHDIRTLDANLEQVHRLAGDIFGYVARLQDSDSLQVPDDAYQQFEVARNHETDSYELYANDLERYRDQRESLDAVVKRRRAYDDALREFQEYFTAVITYAHGPEGLTDG
jgi:hypothetical protein